MVILAIIFVGMLINKNIEKKKNDISIEEIKKIESYIQQIYMWKEIANEITTSNNEFGVEKILEKVSKLH